MVVVEPVRCFVGFFVGNMEKYEINIGRNWKDEGIGVMRHTIYACLNKLSFRVERYLISQPNDFHWKKELLNKEMPSALKGHFFLQSLLSRFSTLF